MKLRRSGRVLAWFGLLAASATLEWTRLHSLDVHLPGEAGGLLWGTIGAYAQSWLGFTGSALLALVLASALIAVVFKFSWGQLC